MTALKHLLVVIKVLMRKYITRAFLVFIHLPIYVASKSLYIKEVSEL